MKKIILLLAVMLISIGVIAWMDEPWNKDLNNKYCAKMKDGLLRVMHDGEEITVDVTLANGTQIKPDGTVVKKDGTRYLLKEGECVDLEGRIEDLPVKEENKK